MSTASITPVRRALGWNLVFLAGSQAEKFAGVFSPPGSDTLTYRHIIDEFRLCFDMATVSRTPDVWHDIAFFQAGIQGGLRRPVPNNATGQIISGSNLDTPVETLPFTDVSEMMSTPSVTRMHVVRHHDCNLNVSEPLETHIRGMFISIFLLLLFSRLDQRDAHNIFPYQLAGENLDIFHPISHPKIQSSRSYHTAKQFVPNLNLQANRQNGLLPAWYRQLRIFSKIVT